MCLQSDTSHCFFFNDTATTEIYTLSLHDALPISQVSGMRKSTTSPYCRSLFGGLLIYRPRRHSWLPRRTRLVRSEEHTSELQSRQYLVCRLLLEKKKTYYVLLFTRYI